MKYPKHLFHVLEPSYWQLFIGLLLFVTGLAFSMHYIIDSYYVFLNLITVYFLAIILKYLYIPLFICSNYFIEYWIFYVALKVPLKLSISVVNPESKIFRPIDSRNNTILVVYINSTKIFNTVKVNNRTLEEAYKAQLQYGNYVDKNSFRELKALTQTIKETPSHTVIIGSLYDVETGTWSNDITNITHGKGSIVTGAKINSFDFVTRKGLTKQGIVKQILIYDRTEKTGDPLEYVSVNEKVLNTPLMNRLISEFEFRKEKTFQEDCSYISLNKYMRLNDKETKDEAKQLLIRRAIEDVKVRRFLPTDHVENVLNANESEIDSEYIEKVD